MDSAGVFLRELLVFYGIRLLGFVARKSGVLNKNANEVLTQLVLYITFRPLFYIRYTAANMIPTLKPIWKSGRFFSLG